MPPCPEFWIRYNRQHRSNSKNLVRFPLPHSSHIGGNTKFSLISFSMRNSVHYSFVFASASNSRSVPSYGSAPQYLKAHCIPVSSIHNRYTRRSLARGHLVVPWTRTSMAQLSQEVLLLWAHPTGASFLVLLEIFNYYRPISSAST